MSEGRARIAAAGALGGVAFLLFAVQLHVFPDLKLEVARRGMPGSIESVVQVLRSSGSWHHWGPIAAIPLLLVLLLGTELFGRGVSSLVGRITRTPFRALLTALVLVLVLTRFFADPGIPHGYDAKLHYMMAGETARLLAAGSAPDWSFTFYAGYPGLRFNGPLLYLLAAPLSWVTGSVSAALKIVVWGATLSGAAAVFALVRRLGGSARGALLGAVAAAVSFQHTHELALAGRLPVSLLYLLFPLLLLEAERLATGAGWRAAIRTGLWAALLAYAHPGLAGYGVLAAVLYLAVRAVLGRGPGVALARVAPRLVLAGGVAAVLCLGLAVPALIEMPHHHVSRMYAPGVLTIDASPDLGRLARLAVWSNTFTTGSVTYVGLSVLVLFVVTLSRRGALGGMRVPLAATAALLLFLVGGRYLSARSVHFLVVLLATGAGLAFRWDSVRCFTLVLAVLIADLGFTTVQSPFRPDLGYDMAFMRRTALRTDGARALRVSLRHERFDTSEWAATYDSGQPVITGPFREAASADLHPLLLDLLARVRDDLEAGPTLSDATRFALRVYGCRHLLAEDGQRPLVLPVDGPGLEPQAAPPAVLVRDARPAVAVIRKPAFADLAREELESWDRALAASPPELRDPARSGLTIAVVEARPRVVRIDLRAERTGVLLLSYSALPGVAARVDGDPRPVLEGPFGLAGVEIAEGEHRVELFYRAPGYLVATRWISLAGLVAVLLLLLVAPRTGSRSAR